MASINCDIYHGGQISEKVTDAMLRFRRMGRSTGQDMSTSILEVKGMLSKTADNLKVSREKRD